VPMPRLPIRLYDDIGSPDDGSYDFDHRALVAGAGRRIHEDIRRVAQKRAAILAVIEA